MFPSSGYGQSSKYFDDELLFDGTYQIISVTVHSSSRDDNNPTDTEILRAGLLLAKDPDHEGLYIPLSTADGYLNGTPTQFMSDVVVLARKEYITKDFIMGLTRQRTVTATNRVVPAYLSCNIFTNKLYYNNSTVVAITDSQWNECQRIVRVAAGASIYEPSGEVWALLWNRVETIVSPSDL